MCSLSTSSPVASDTFWYRIRPPDRSSTWLKAIDLCLTAVKSFTGTESRPTVSVPVHVARAAIRGVCYPAPRPSRPTTVVYAARRVGSHGLCRGRPGPRHGEGIRAEHNHG